MDLPDEELLQHSTLRRFSQDAGSDDDADPGSPVEEALPWMAHHQPLALNDLPHATAPLVFDGFIPQNVPQAFPSDFSFVNENRVHPQPASVNDLPAWNPDLPDQFSDHAESALAIPNYQGQLVHYGTSQPNLNMKPPKIEPSRPAENGTDDKPREKRKRGRPKIKGTGKRGGWSKGLKIGPRATITPSDEFNKLHQKAMDAWIDHQDADTALKLILDALEINPEIYSAHTLLCEIYMSQGEEQKAFGALWMGAHAYPRDPFVWEQCIDTCLHRTTYDRRIAWTQVAYSFRKLLHIDKNSFEYRFQYASALAKTGKSKPATTQLDKHLFPTMPRNSSCLKLYAEAAQNLNRLEWAIDKYDSTMAYYEQNGMTEDDSFEWMDVNVYTELITSKQGNPVERIAEAISVCKRLSRWLLGRARERYWDQITDNDCEWDGEDDPRRCLVELYDAGDYEQASYGIGLPLEIRAQLGVLRLRLGGCRDEALAHFEWLEPEDNAEDASLHQLPDVFLTVANALSEAMEHQEALRFYEPLMEAKAFETPPFYVSVGTSSYICGKKRQAMECFEAALALDSTSVEAKTYLSKLHTEQGDKEKAFKYAQEAVKIARTGISRSDRRKYEVKGNRVIRQAAEAAFKDASALARPKSNRGRKRKIRSNKEGQRAHGADYLMPVKKVKTAHQKILNVNDGARIRQLYDTLVYNTEDMRAGLEPAKTIWTECARDMVDFFTNFTLFFYADPNERFKGYGVRKSYHPQDPLAGVTSETPSTAPSPSPYNPDLALPSVEQFESLNTDPPTIPNDFHGIDFSDWLDVFLEYAMVMSLHPSLPHASRRESSYKLVRDTLRSCVFKHEYHYTLRIHTAWLAITLNLRDENTLFNIVLRWFVGEHIFCTDVYRLFGGINLLFPHRNPAHTIFANPVSQKLMWSHVLTLDHSLPLTYTSPNDSDAPVPEFMRKARDEHIPVTVTPQEMDIVLLTVYGQISFASGSFATALQYFFRARALDPTNAMVLLSISLVYFHEACKKPGKGKAGLGVDGNMEVLQGWAVFKEYEDARIRWAETNERAGDGDIVETVKREVQFNKARVWMMLGMGDLAMRAMEKLLGEGNDEGDKEKMNEAGERGEKLEWQREAAYAMANNYASHGDAATARKITEMYLVVE